MAFEDNARLSSRAVEARQVTRRRARLHCRSCGSPVSKPLVEATESRSGLPVAGTYVWLYRVGPEVSRQRRRLAGPDVGILRIKRRDLDGSVLPLEHHPDRVGCCGFPGGTEPNIRCHACGHWVLVDIEDCQAPAMTAARTNEIEVRPVSPRRVTYSTAD